MRLRKQNSTNYPIAVLMVDSTDHISPKLGLSPAIKISKSGGALSTALGAVTEIGNGWYALAGNSTDRNTLGEYIISATATGADPYDEKYEIVSYDPFDIPGSVAASLLVSPTDKIQTNSDNSVKLPSSYKLDRLFGTACISADVTDNSFAAKMTSKTGVFSTFVPSTDSQEGIADSITVGSSGEIPFENLKDEEVIPAKP